jgi:hypothetical protein
MTAANLLESGVDTEPLPTNAFGVVLRPTASKLSISSPSISTTSESTPESHAEDTTPSSPIAKRPPPPRPKRKPPVNHSQRISSTTVSISELSHQDSNHSLKNSITLVDTTLPNLPPRPSSPPPIPPKPTDVHNNTLNTRKLLLIIMYYNVFR